MKGPEAQAVHEARKAERERRQGIADAIEETASNAWSASIKGVTATAVSQGEKH